ncbi:hypothetical protein HPB49_011313 [Dermacentor silvarum]|uniref:Uncharacterized protein n=1 Tax=Dermacentor silvarum TaxID=543639 RepID=A0ACB8DJ53_DERSI|nr:hypothetical protein HPB49_011313 [Dermacentor silvarum]
MKDPNTATTFENSVSRDINPGLIITARIPQVEWTRLYDTMESVHHVVHTKISYRRALLKVGKGKITDWITFQKEGPTRTAEYAEDWTKIITEQAEKYTEKIQPFSPVGSS